MRFVLAPVSATFQSVLEWQAARKLTGQMNELLAEQAKATDEKLRLTFKDDKWTDVHSFYVVMGGLVIDTTDLPQEEKFLPQQRDRFTLSPEAFLLVAQHCPSVIDFPSEAEIKDKSKGGAMLYFLASLNIVRLLVSVAFRLSKRPSMTVSLLELTTFAHIICMLPILWFWWDKPLDIGVPSLIEAQRAKHFFALLFMFAGWKVNDDDAVQASDSDFLITQTQHSTSTTLDVRKTPRLYACSHQTSDPGYCTVLEGQSFGPLFKRGLNPNVSGKYFDCRQCGLRIHQDPLVDVNRWNLISEGYEKDVLDQVISRWGYIQDKDAALRQFIPSWPLVAQPSWTQGSLSSYSSSMVHEWFLCSSITDLLYGAIMMLAWNGPYPSSTERTLWRISVIVNVTGGLATFLKLLVWKAIERDRQKPRSERRHNRSAYSQALRLVLGLLSFPVEILVWASRIFILFEGFYSLPFLPDAAFKQPQWLYYL